MKIPFLFLTFAVLNTPLISAESLMAQEEYNRASVAFQRKKWSDVKIHGKNILENAKDSPYANEINFYLGAAYFHQKDYSLSNYYLTEFLKDSKAPKFFEEAIEYKFLIAERYQNGAKKHLLGIEKLPKITPAWEDALALYDEVITTLPKHPVAAKALFNKALMQKNEGKFSESIESLQTLIRRFPKDPLTPKSYLAIVEAYLVESKDLFPDRDFLEQAKLNIKKFKKDFPQDERVQEAEKLLTSMQNSYARDLWDSANYYAKKKKVKSSILYYTSIIHKYPESKYASLALKKISELKVYYPEEVANASYQEIQH
jgi:outer membrane protein assembly factor BamD (BamD/ComL family)